MHEATKKEALFVCQFFAVNKSFFIGETNMTETGFRTDYAATFRAGTAIATGLIVLLVFALTCCNRENETDKKAGLEEVDQKSRSDCERISKRNLQCIGVLVSIVEKESRSVMAAVIHDVADPERNHLEQRVNQALESGKEDLTNTLKESLRKPFMNWCLRAAGDPGQKKILDEALKCLEKPDCQTYGKCFEEILATQRSKADSLDRD